MYSNIVQCIPKCEMGWEKKKLEKTTDIGIHDSAIVFIMVYGDWYVYYYVKFAQFHFRLLFVYWSCTWIFYVAITQDKTSTNGIVVPSVNDFQTNVKKKKQKKRMKCIFCSLCYIFFVGMTKQKICTTQQSALCFVLSIWMNESNLYVYDLVSFMKRKCISEQSVAQKRAFVYYFINSKKCQYWPKQLHTRHRPSPFPSIFVYLLWLRQDHK